MDRLKEPDLVLKEPCRQHLKGLPLERRVSPRRRPGRCLRTSSVLVFEPQFILREQLPNAIYFAKVVSVLNSAVTVASSWTATPRKTFRPCETIEFENHNMKGNLERLRRGYRIGDRKQSRGGNPTLHCTASELKHIVPECSIG